MANWRCDRLRRQELIDVLNKTSDMEKLLTPTGGSFMPDTKTINGKVEFQIWRAELKRILQMLKQQPLIVETLELLDSGFQTGWTDEKDFINLQAKLKVIAEHIDDYFDNQEEAGNIMNSQKLKKGTKVHTAFDEYTLIKQVGSGGNGRVFSAKNPNDELFAIKFIEKSISSDKLKRFKNEIHFCEYHEHKNIIKILDRGYAFLDDKDFVFYVMPLMAETLKDKIKAGISHENIVNIFIGILQGLKYAHTHKAIHRDIKPENILFAEDSSEPIICDFGIAHFAEENLLTAVETRVADRMANFQYAAPEQRNRGSEIKPQTDIYAAALILNEMFTGEIPLAAGYKTIASINEDYKYLDDLFDQIFKQEPDDRLYPEEIIISEMKRLAEVHHKEQEKIKLQSVVNEMITPDEFEAKIINIEYKSGFLVFTFDQNLPEEWLQSIIYGNYSHSYMLGYDNNNLQKASRNSLRMQIRGSETENTIKSIVGNVKDWVKTINREYSSDVKRQIESEYRRKEAERISKIQELEKETEKSSKINSILSDLI